MEEKLKAVVFGMGVSGKSAAQFLYKSGYEVSIYDDNPEVLINISKSGQYSIYESGVKYDTGIISPGFSLEHPAVKSSKDMGTDIIGDVELASRYLDSEKIIAVTGTNGKSTTVSLIASILEEAGYAVFLCGNIGTSVLEAVGKGYDFLVIEISSFQLETLSSLHPDVSAILNVSPDHLDRYSSYEDYLLTKVRLGRLTKTDGLLVLNGGDDALLAGCRSIQVEKKMFSWDKSSEYSYFNGIIFVGNNEIRMEDTRLTGSHNVENIMAAILSVSKWVADIEVIKNSLNKFKPLPHRMEFAGSIGDVVFIDDSKGTNVGATEKSLAGYDERSVVLILGGVDKGGSYESLRELAEKKCKGVVLIGQAKSIIKPYFDDFHPVVESHSMKDAVKESYRLSNGSGTVLFSPACSSFDWYKNYKERGVDFKNNVLELKEEMSK